MKAGKSGENVRVDPEYHRTRTRNIGKVAKNKWIPLRHQK